MINQQRYNEIKKASVRIDNSTPLSILPTPNGGNYAEGYIMRYFLQRRDTPGSVIFEVDDRNFSRFNSNPYYKGLVIKWRITGNLTEESSILKDGAIIKTPSVISTNAKVINEAAKEMSDIKLHLVDLKQFWKPLQ